MRYQRELTAAVLIPAVLAILVLAPPWVFTLLVAAAATAALLEFYRLIEAAGWIVPKWAGLLLFWILLGASHRSSASALAAGAAGTVLLLPTLVLFASPPESLLLPSSASSVFATLYVAAGGGAIIGLRTLGWKPVFFVLAVVWAADSAAYYVGRRWGRRKLAPVVSPKKTWAGLGGELGAGFAVGGLLPLVGGAGAGTAVRGSVLGLLVAGLSVVGDLVESAFKRSCALKDSGGILPGHGGFLDRLDSLLYASPVIFLVLTLLPEALPR